MRRWVHTHLFRVTLLLAIAAVGRALLLASDTVSFHADEAVVGLMARHILAGERPTFFYGQAYMGTLNAWLTAGGFALVGDSVTTIRLVQSVTYLLWLATCYAVAWRLSGRRDVTVLACLFLAVPTPALALYTSASLGGYNEMLLLSNLALLAGLRAADHPRAWGAWAALGLCAGVGWWTNGLIIAAGVPLGVLLLARARRQRAWAGIALAALAFFAGSAPWWADNLQNDWRALLFYVPGVDNDPHVLYGDRLSTVLLAPAQLPGQNLLERFVGFAVLSIPAAIGARFPWTPLYWLEPTLIPMVMLYAAAFWSVLRQPASDVPLTPVGRALVLGMTGVLFLLVIVSGFGADPTGRYLLPLALPGTLALAALVVRLAAGARWRRLLAGGLVALLLAYHVAGQVSAARSPTGFTTQYGGPTPHIPNGDDAPLLAFLDAHGIAAAVTQHWVSFRLAFLTDERLAFATFLPFRDTLVQRLSDDRYPPLTWRAVCAWRAGSPLAYITALTPGLDAYLSAQFTALGYRFQTTTLGAYVVYWDFAPAPPPLPDLAARLGYDSALCEG